MENPNIDVSVVVPFYKGNRYINELVSNVNQTARELMSRQGATMEIVIINDSPDVPVELTAAVEIPVRVIANEKNLGIHGSRVHGIRQARGAFIQLLDQDDLLIPEHYPQQFALARNNPVTVGNAYYYRGQHKQLLYASRRVMQYYIQETRFLQIRDLIASPGHCLIRKDVFPAYWLENTMSVNGADDFYLWMLLFHQGTVFALQDKPVYIHRNSEEGNLSFDLDRMQLSNEEMCRLLQANPEYPRSKHDTLKRSIDFKYLHDTRKLGLLGYLKHFDKVVQNGIYKAMTLFLS